jgi:hypothetical protein
MSVASCPRLFEAEAVRDGRLSGAELASFKRHATICTVCSHEAIVLESLAAPLRSASSGQREDELHVRRERTRLLAAFERTLFTSEPRPRYRMLGSAAVGALVAVLFLLLRLRATAHTASASHVLVHADSTASWTKSSEADQEKIILERGALSVRVDHSSGPVRCIVVLPDGELEDIGTVFTVSVEDGRTTRVAVEEGSVVLRIRSQPLLALGAGERWSPTARPAASAASACAQCAPSAELSPGAQLSPPAQSSATVRSAPPLAASAAPDPLADFRSGVAALSAGNHREAAERFARFLAKHPRDPQAEDASYLRVIALQRCGDTGSMRQAAVEYMRSYPRGFRHADLEALVGDVDR